MADMEAVLQKTVDYFGGHIPGVAAFLVKIIVCIVIYIIGKNVIGWVVKTVRSMLLRTKMQTGAATFIVSMVKIFLYLILIFGLAMQFGVKESSVAALVASGGVAIGLALQGGLSNLAGGFLILLFQPFEVGDYILAQGEEGTVQKIRDPLHDAAHDRQPQGHHSKRKPCKQCDRQCDRRRPQKTGHHGRNLLRGRYQQSEAGAFADY